MALTPEDLVQKTFQTTKFREGYDPNEVDDFLDEVVVEFRKLIKENEELRKRLASSSGNYNGFPNVGESAAPKTGSIEMQPPVAAPAPVAAANTLVGGPEESATGVLVMAQRLHDEYVRSGIEKRDKIVAEAQLEATSLINDAQEKHRQSLVSMEQQRALLERKVEQLRGFEREYRTRLRAYIEGQLRDLDSRGSVVGEDGSGSLTKNTGSFSS